MTNFCPTIKPGENRLAECLSNQLDMELKGNAEGESAAQTLSLMLLHGMQLMCIKFAHGHFWSGG